MMRKTIPLFGDVMAIWLPWQLSRCSGCDTAKSFNNIQHRVRKKGTDSILAVTSINLDNVSHFLAKIILTIHVTETDCQDDLCQIL